MSKFFSNEPEDQNGYTAKNDRFYTLFAGIYDFGVRFFPIWKKWLDQALPHVQGPKVLEISFGTGFLLGKLAGDHELFGIDLNEKMTRIAQKNLNKAGLEAGIARGNVENLPFGDEAFDTVVNTMAFSGYPDAEKALAEILRVLKPDGKLVLIDVNYPGDGNARGVRRTAMWKKLGDIIRDMDELFNHHGLEYTDDEIGGYGSIHLYVGEKRKRP